MKALEGFAVRTGPKVVNERSGFRETNLRLAGWPLSQPMRQSFAERRHHRGLCRVRSIVLCGLAVIAIGSALGALYVGLWLATAASIPSMAPGFDPVSYSKGQVELSTPSDCDGEPSSFRTARIC